MRSGFFKRCVSGFRKLVVSGGARDGEEVASRLRVPRVARGIVGLL
jgi:hypothetical protein